MKTLYLHIGTPKTGTTSIQSVFQRSSKNLAETYNLYYLSKTHHHDIAYEAFRNNVSQIHTLKRDEFVQQFEASGCDNALLCTEYGSLHNSASITRMADYFKRHFSSIVVSVYVRHPLSYANSQIQQYVKRGRGYLKDFLEHPPRIPFEDLLTCYASEFGRDNISVRIFDRDRLWQQDIVEDFCKLMKIDRATLAPSVKDLNVGLSLEHVIIADAINRSLDSRGQGHLKRDFFDVAAEFPQTDIKQKFRLPNVVANKLMDDSRADTDFLYSEYALQFDQLNKSPEIAPSWNDAEVTQMAELFVDSLLLSQA